MRPGACPAHRSRPAKGHRATHVSLLRKMQKAQEVRRLRPHPRRRNRPNRTRSAAARRASPQSAPRPSACWVNYSPPDSPSAMLGSARRCWRAAIVQAVYDKSIDRDQVTSYLCATSHFYPDALTTFAPETVFVCLGAQTLPHQQLMSHGRADAAVPPSPARSWPAVRPPKYRHN